MLLAMPIVWLAPPCTVDHYNIVTFYFCASGMICGAAAYTVPGNIVCIEEREPQPGTVVAWQEARAYSADNTFLPQECQPALPVSQ